MFSLRYQEYPGKSLWPFICIDFFLGQVVYSLLILPFLLITCSQSPCAMSIQKDQLWYSAYLTNLCIKTFVFASYCFRHHTHLEILFFSFLLPIWISDVFITSNRETLGICSTFPLLNTSPVNIRIISNSFEFERFKIKLISFDFRFIVKRVINIHTFLVSVFMDRNGNKTRLCYGCGCLYEIRFDRTYLSRYNPQNIFRAQEPGKFNSSQSQWRMCWSTNPHKFFFKHKIS